jgi:hypothetical protein
MFEGSLGMHSSLMLAFPLQPLLAELCTEMTSGEVFDWHLKSTTCALQQGKGTLIDQDAHKILGMSHKKLSA